jgi:BON domain
MNTATVLAAAGLGAALTFMLDPNSGRRRRARVRDRITRATRVARKGMNATTRDFTNRARGVAATTQARLSDQEVDDARLEERVRSRLGRAASHPRAIEVASFEGDVTLRGPILSSEVQDVIALVRGIPGVQRVINGLEAHETPDNVPSLQGEPRLASPSLDILQRNWAPVTRALVTAGVLATGVCLLTYARRQSEHDVDYGYGWV